MGCRLVAFTRLDCRQVTSFGGQVEQSIEVGLNNGCLISPYLGRVCISQLISDLRCLQQCSVVKRIEGRGLPKAVVSTGSIQISGLRPVNFGQIQQAAVRIFRVLQVLHKQEQRRVYLPGQAEVAGAQGVFCQAVYPQHAVVQHVQTGIVGCHAGSRVGLHGFSHQKNATAHQLCIAEDCLVNALFDIYITPPLASLAPGSVHIGICHCGAQGIDAYLPDAIQQECILCVFPAGIFLSDCCLEAAVLHHRVAFLINLDVFDFYRPLTPGCDQDIASGAGIDGGDGAGCAIHNP